MRPVRFALAAALVAEVLVPGTGHASATAPSVRHTVTVTGPAGAYAAVHFPADVAADEVSAAASADSGDLVGVAIYGRTAGGALPFYRVDVSIRRAALCAECPQPDVPDVRTSRVRIVDGRAVLPAGFYTLAVLGSPGALVSARFVLPGLPPGTTVLRPHDRTHMASRRPGLTAGTGQTHAAAHGRDGEHTGARVTLAGMLLGMVTTAGMHLAYETCVSDRSEVEGGACPAYGAFGYGVLGLPADVTRPEVTTGAGIVLTVAHPQAYVRYTVGTAGARARVLPVAFWFAVPDW